MRLIGGSAAGTILKVPKGFEVRPTPDLVRQAIFNSLGPRVADAAVLEVFCRNRRVESGMSQSRRGQRRLRRKIQPSRPIHPAKPRPGPPARDRAGKFAFKTRSPPWSNSPPPAVQFDLLLADPPYGVKKCQPALHLTCPATARRTRPAKTSPGRRSLHPRPHQRDTLDLPPHWQ